MERSSEQESHSTIDGRHDAAIDDARLQFERLRMRTRVSPAGGTDKSADAMSVAWLTESLPGYEIGSEIHRGGQGVVFKSIQRGTQREVAIKVMREGPFSGAREKARFEREIQILGQLKHPNIVTIHESGSSAQGFYFVMDYIPGTTLDAYVGDAKLGVRDTLSLFSKVCHAVHVAHLRGVIHRDLKPANIRVDCAGEPHVLDFGLAKVNEDDDLANIQSVARSVTGQFIGSLPWASPEQIEGQPGEVDLRTDVYALGVMLFQVLAGRMPYGTVGNVRQIVENICRVEPQAPGSIRGEIDDEVDAIVLKCLRKEKAQRYQSAGEVARDIDRYLAGEPIEARSDSGWYILSKHLRKHRLAVGIATTFILVVTAAFGTSLAFWRQAVRDRDTAQFEKKNADAARDVARREEVRANAVVGFLTRDVLMKLDPYNAQGEDLTARALFKQAAADIDAGAFQDQPLVEFDLRTTLGLVYEWLSDYAKAESQFRPALKIARRELGEQDEKTLETMRRLGSALSLQGKLDEAEPLLREALDVQTRVLGADHLSTILSRSKLAGWYMDAERPAEAEALYRDVLEHRMRLQGPEHTQTLTSMNNLAGALTAGEKYKEAEPLYRQSLETSRRVREARHPETLLGLMHYAELLLYMNQPDTAVTLAEEAFEGLREQMGNSHVSTSSCRTILARAHEALAHWKDAEPLLRDALRYQRDSKIGNTQLNQVLYHLAANLSKQGKMAEAEEFLREARAELDRTRGSTNERLRVLFLLTSVLGELRKDEDAIAVAAEAVELSRQAYGDDGEATIIALNNHGYTFLNAGKSAEAETVFRTALAAQRRLGRDDDLLTLNLMHNIALALGNQQIKEEERESLLRATVAGRRKLLGDKDTFTLKTIHALATILRERNKFEEAESLFHEAVTSAESVWPDGHFLTEHFRRGLGVCLKSMKRYDEAEPLLLLSHEHDVKLLPQGHPNHIEGMQKLIELYEAWGKPEQADAWRAKQSESSRPIPLSQSSDN